MDTLKLFFIFSALFLYFSVPCVTLCAIKQHDHTHLGSKTDKVYSFDRDSASLMILQTFGLMPDRFSVTLALLSCFIMRTLIKIIALPNKLHTTVLLKQHYCSSSDVLCRALIILLLMISGNVHIHPGPSSDVLSGVVFPTDRVASKNICFDDFCNRNNLGFLHVNARSILPKLDQLKVWVESSRPDVLVITETWLRNSIPYPDLYLSG